TRVLAVTGFQTSALPIFEQPVDLAQRLDRRREIAFGSEKPSGQFDLITICDCIHDLAAPVETLRAIHRLLKADGTLIIVEPKARSEERRVGKLWNDSNA